MNQYGQRLRVLHNQAFPMSPFVVTPPSDDHLNGVLLLLLFIYQAPLFLEGAKDFGVADKGRDVRAPVELAFATGLQL